MGVRGIRVIASIAAVGAVAEGPIGAVALGEGAACPIGVVEVPAPGQPHEIERAGCLGGGEVAFDFHGFDIGYDVVW